MILLEPLKVLDLIKQIAFVKFCCGTHCYVIILHSERSTKKVTKFHGGTVLNNWVGPCHEVESGMCRVMDSNLVARQVNLIISRLCAMRFINKACCFDSANVQIAVCYVFNIHAFDNEGNDDRAIFQVFDDEVFLADVVAFLEC